MKLLTGVLGYRAAIHSVADKGEKLEVGALWVSKKPEHGLEQRAAMRAEVRSDGGGQGICPAAG